MKLTDKQMKRANELLDKVLNKNRSLDADELAELHKFLEILFKIQEDKDSSFSEKMDTIILKKALELVVKRDAEIKFNQLPLEERTKMLKKEINELKASPAFKAIKEKAKKHEEDKAFEDFYTAHVEKHGKSL